MKRFGDNLKIFFKRIYIFDDQQKNFESFSTLKLFLVISVHNANI